MATSSDHTKVKRLLHLYLLNIKIAEPYHRVISRIFEFLKFDDYKDLNEKDFRDNLLTVTKYDSKGEVVCYITHRLAPYEPSITFRGSKFYYVLKDMYESIHEKEVENFYEVRDYMVPFIICILYRKGIVVDDVYL